jgi:uncharacterized membrane protein
MMTPSSPAPRPLPAIRTLEPLQPLQWLVAGWQDIWRCGWLSLAHGAVLALFGAALFALARQKFWLLAGAFSGFLVVAPVLATRLYAMSRALERKEPIGLALLRDTWLSWQQAVLSTRHGRHTGAWCASASCWPLPARAGC